MLELGITMASPAIAFYIPPAFWPESFPPSADANWSGFGLGLYAWTLQTYLRLQAAGVPCQLVSQLPETGLVFLHRNALRGHRQPLPIAPRRLLVCFQGDLPPSPVAQVHIVQNPTAAQPQQQCYFMPHWPQPGLWPRCCDRGDRFETVAFFGHSRNLAPELQQPAWSQALAKLGLRWQPVINTNRWNHHASLDTRWNDYRTVDVVVAVRSFQPVVLRQRHPYPHKPPTKLYNAWLAGVPAILGPESAYQAERQCPLDYLEADSPAAILQALTWLRDQPAHRRAMVAQGQRRSQAIHPAALTQRWQQLIEATLLPQYERWCRQPRWQQQWSRQRAWITYAQSRLWQRFRYWRYANGGL